MEAHPKLRPVDTPTSGIFLAGACQGPKDIPTSVAYAKAAASSVATLLYRGKIQVESSVAYVNEEYCSGCKLCTSLCVYGAIEIHERDKGLTVAFISEVSCTGCGVCVSACPTKAITLRHFTDQQLIAQIRAVLFESDNTKQIISDDFAYQ